MKKRVLSAMPSQTFEEGALDAAQQTGKLSYDGYKKVWSDEFNGDSLNRADWNVETHEKGWVNNELQEFVDSAENIQVKDGKLIINPVKKVTDGDTGSTKEAASYTSGRVSTQNKQTFIYGRFECRAKVPKGKGTLAYPAPFDQPFYVILNLAVGGSWVGNPNDETSFENNPYVIDYVRVYRKDSYDEDVKRHGKESYTYIVR